MTRLLIVAALSVLAGCSSVGSTSRSDSTIKACSKEYFRILEQKKEVMETLDAEFFELDRNPSEENHRKKNAAALVAATAASDLDYAHAACSGPGDDES